MKGNELVWRTIADAALAGTRRWSSVSAIADAAGVPPTTGYLAMERLLDIGAVEQRSPGGVSTTSPERVLTLLAAWRNIKRDTLARTSLAGARAVMDRATTPYAIGGADAAIHHTGGRNTVADIGTRLVYVPKDTDLTALPSGGEVIVLEMDRRAQRDWDGYTSVAQTYADLFALPGWQAAEFRRALHKRFFSTPDWDQEVVDG